MPTPAPEPGRTNALRWYRAACAFSLVGLIFQVVSHINPRLGYPVAFVFTMWGVLALTRPAWDRPEQRVKVIVANVLAATCLLAVWLVNPAV